MKAKYHLEKDPFLKNVELFIKAREKNLNNLKSKIFLVKNPDETPTTVPAPEMAPNPESDPIIFDTPKTTKAKTKRKIPQLKQPEEFLNDNIN